MSITILLFSMYLYIFGSALSLKKQKKTKRVKFHHNSITFQGFLTSYI